MKNRAYLRRQQQRTMSIQEVFSGLGEAFKQIVEWAFYYTLLMVSIYAVVTVFIPFIKIVFGLGQMLLNRS